MLITTALVWSQESYKLLQQKEKKLLLAWYALNRSISEDKGGKLMLTQCLSIHIQKLTRNAWNTKHVFGLTISLVVPGLHVAVDRERRKVNISQQL